MDELVAEGVDATVTQATRQTPWRPILSGGPDTVTTLIAAGDPDGLAAAARIDRR